MNVNLDDELRGAPPAGYGNDFSTHLLEEYKLYVSMADKISERRQAANTFFLAINSAVITALGITWPSEIGASKFSWFIVVSAVGILLCLSWNRLLRSYKDLNSAKFVIIGKLEGYLPVRPYAAEWKLVGEGKVSRQYLPLSHIELKIPFFFMLLYIALAGIVPLTANGSPATEKTPTTIFVEENGCKPGVTPNVETIRQKMEPQKGKPR
jgi:hypothetical protein